MKREVKGLYGQCFQFAFDIAKKAERALAARAGRPGAELSPVRLPGRQGGPAGRREALPGPQAHGDGLPRPEPARVRADQARQPAAGRPAGAAATCARPGAARCGCPEALFDMDGPGHYFRRIKSRRAEHPLRDRPVRQRQLHADAAQEQHPHDASCCATASTRARTPRTTASATTSAACSRSSPAPHRTTAACSRPTCATSATCRSRTPARSASGSSSCRPTRAGRAAPVRLRHDQRRHPAHPLHGARGRRAAAARRDAEPAGRHRRRAGGGLRAAVLASATSSRTSGRA